MHHTEATHMQTQQAVLATIIGAIGEENFAAVAADAVSDFLEFDLSAVVVHRRADRAFLMFDNFDAIGGRQGMNNYVAVTHRANPVLDGATRLGAFRARDFSVRRHAIGASLAPYVLSSPDEELGFRTIGWPEKLEEIGLYFKACGGIVELSVYRERARRIASATKLQHLEALTAPIAAAFDKHARFAQPATSPATLPMVRLSQREAQITELLLLGCGSEAIALRLNISRYTVKDHRKQIFRKLGIGSLAELFALYRRVS
jgi:DNA-binding CsgD family transcriptional regulator